MQKFAHHLKEEFHQSRNLIFIIFVFCMAVVFSFFSTRDMQTSQAANPSNFNPGNIISDAVMSNYTSMSIDEIQNFLSSKNKCDNRNYDLYLQYKANQPNINWHWEGEPYNGHFVCMAEERFGDGEVIGTGMTAAEIIYDAAQQNQINPQVLLVLLQKESSLITDKVPNDFDYRKATGYGCPDTAACDSKYYGFKNQIYRAAELFRYVLDKNSVYYPAGHTVNVGYHPNPGCGSTRIFIENRATAALYQYTPYQPNAAALSAGYGTGDACSAYGNRNFYLYFTDWFGSTTYVKVDGELVTIPDGEYSLVSAVANNRTLGLQKTNAALAELNLNDKTQRWKLQRDSNTGYYQIINLSTNQPLITETASPTLHTNVINGASTTCSRFWKIYRTPDNYLTFESSCSEGMVLDVKNGASAVSTNVEIYTTDGTVAQKWQLQIGPTISDGIYNIRTMLDTDKDLEIYGDYEYDGANVSIWSHLDRENRKWQAAYDATSDTYTFVNLISNKALDLFGGIPSNGANVGIYTQNQSCAQKWKLVLQPNGSYSILSSCTYGYGLDVRGANNQNGANVSIWSTNNHASQQWQITPIHQSIPNGVYNLRTRLHPNKELEVYGDYDYDGANVSLWEHIDRDNREWNISYHPDTDEYTIINQRSQKALDLKGALPRNGQNIQIWTPNNSCSQRWSISAVSDGYYTIRSACDRHQVLDIYEAHTDNGTNVTSFTNHNQYNQQWRFQLID